MSNASNITSTLSNYIADRILSNDWLKHGTGGTCWAGNGALYSLLSVLRFNVTRGVATMLVAPDIPPNHGSVIARFGDDEYLVDASILHRKPILLKIESDNLRQFPAWVNRLFFDDGKWFVEWQPLHREGRIVCRFEYTGATQSDFNQRHERTRLWSPFNYELILRQAFPNDLKGIASGRKVTLNELGEIREVEIDAADRVRVLVEEFRYSEEIATALPPDCPTPPPPWSRTAQMQAQDDDLAQPGTYAQTEN